MVTVLIVVAAVVILGVGFFRARPFGKLGILAWLQSVVLMAPWLAFFGLFALGIYLNLISILLLFLISTGLYIFLGSQLRAASQDPALAEQLAAMRAAAIAKAGKVSGDEGQAGEEAPASAIAQLPETSPIPADDLRAIQGIFGIETFFATETIPFQDGAIFNGNLRGDAEAVYTRLSASLQERLGDRYRLFLVENPQGKPVVVVLPRTNEPQPTTLPQKVLAGVLFVATLATCLEQGGIQAGFDFFTNLGRFMEAAPIALGILAVLITHELGHWWMARRYQVRLSWPFFIPAWQVGSFGAITRFESILPNRSVLFDISIAGPICGGLVALTMLIGGLVLSRGPAPVRVPSEIFEGSLLVGALARVVMGTALKEAVVTIHPLAIVGWVGLVITAINLMPAGQLDGGRIVQAVYGRKVANATTIATLLVLAIGALFNALALYWAVVILVLQRGLERPSLNDLTEPDDTRAALALLVLFLMITTLLPLTPSLAGRLGIGG